MAASRTTQKRLLQTVWNSCTEQVHGLAKSTDDALHTQIETIEELARALDIELGPYNGPHRKALRRLTRDAEENEAEDERRQRRSTAYRAGTGDEDDEEEEEEEEDPPVADPSKERLL